MYRGNHARMEGPARTRFLIQCYKKIRHLPVLASKDAPKSSQPKRFRKPQGPMLKDLKIQFLARRDYDRVSNSAW